MAQSLTKIKCRDCRFSRYFQYCSTKDLPSEADIVDGWWISVGEYGGCHHRKFEKMIENGECPNFSMKLRRRIARWLNR
jgi:hypothetical protein